MPHTTHLDDDKSIPESSYAALKPPEEFKSQIPDHLLADATPQDKHIMAALSINSQYSAWLVNAALETHSQVRRTNGKLLKAEAEISALKDDRKAVISGWKLIAAIGGILAGIASFLITVYQALNGGGGH